MCGDVDNQSDHSAIIMSLSLNVKQHAINEQKFTPSKCWNKADWKEIENYKINLERNLSYINKPHDCITCTNYLCNNVEHQKRIQIFHDELIALVRPRLFLTRRTIKIKVMFLDGMIMSNNINKLPFFGVTCGMIMDHQEKAPWPT